MSWHYSRALEEAFSEACSLAGEPSAPWRSMPTALDDSCSDRMKGTCHRSPFGMMCVPSTDTRGEALLRWFRAAFPARTYPQPERARASRANAPDSGVRWRELSVRYDHDTCSWKTHRCLWDEDLSACSLTLPKWGLMRDGVLLERMTLALPTAANDAGLWRTPAAREPGVSASRLIPIEGGTPGGMNRHFDRHTGRMAQIGLMQQVALRQMWPTPVASMSKGSSPAALTRKSGADRSGDRLDHAVMASDGGQLNPTWVEWLMGWPLDWTSTASLPESKFRAWLEASRTAPPGCQQSATDKCPHPPRSHGES